MVSVPAGAQSSLDQTCVPPLSMSTVFGLVPTLRSQGLSEMFLIAIVKVIAVPAANAVPLSGLTVTSMSESEQIAPLALVDGLADVDELADADGDGEDDGVGDATGSVPDEQERRSMKNTINTTRAASPTSRRRRQ